MTISTTTQKVLINVKAEGTNEAARSIASVGKASESTTAALMKQAAAHEKVAEESKSAGTTGESAYTKLSAALGKFNFNMEAGKKIVEIADKGLQAYAKTSAGAAAEALRVQTAFSSAFETVQVEIGRAVVALEPLISGLGTVVEKLAQVGGFAAKGIGDTIGFGQFVAGGGEDFLARYGLSRDKSGELYVSSALDMYRRQGGNAVGFFAQQGLNDAVAAREAAAELAKPGLWKSAGEILSDAITTGVRRAGIDEWSGGMPSTSGGARGRRGVDWSRYKFDTPSSSVALGDSPYGAAAAAYDASGDIDQTLERAEKLNVIAAQTNDWYSRLNFEGPTLLDRLFGDVEAIDAQAAAIMALGGAWNGVASGISAGYAALVDGTGSAAEAAKRAIADTLKAEGASMAVLAIKETGLGVASLALGPIGGASAAAHFKAAAVLAGGAVLAGAAASALGTSNSVAAAQARGSAPASAPSGGSAQTAPQTQVTIVTGDALSDDSPRMRRLKAERMWARARGTTGVVQE